MSKLAERRRGKQEPDLSYGKSFLGERIRERAFWDDRTARAKSQKYGKEQCVWGLYKHLKRRPQTPAGMSSQRPLSVMQSRWGFTL